MTASSRKAHARATRTTTQLATQWFIVSDLGLTAFSGNDGVHVFVNSLATHRAEAANRSAAASRATTRCWRTRKTDDAGFARFEAGLARGEGGLAPAMLVATAQGRLRVPQPERPAFDLTDRGVAGRRVPAGLDAFVYAERGVYRTGETVHLTTLLRDGKGVAVTGVPMTLVVERPDGVEYRRAVVADQGVGGRTLDVPMISTAPTGTWRVRAFTDPKASVGRRDQLPGRRLCAGSASSSISRSKADGRRSRDSRSSDGRRPLPLRRAGLRRSQLEGEMKIRPRGDAARASPATSSASSTTRRSEQPSARRSKTCRRPTRTARRRSPSASTSCRRRRGRSRRRSSCAWPRPAAARSSASSRCRSLRSGPMIGVKPLFAGKSSAKAKPANFDVRLSRPTASAVARSGLRYELLKVERRYQWYRRDGRWEYEPVKKTTRVADGHVECRRRQAGPHRAAACTGAATGSTSRATIADARRRR